MVQPTKKGFYPPTVMQNGDAVRQWALGTESTEGAVEVAQRLYAACLSGGWLGSDLSALQAERSNKLTVEEHFAVFKGKYRMLWTSDGFAVAEAEPRKTGEILTERLNGPWNMSGQDSVAVSWKDSWKDYAVLQHACRQVPWPMADIV